MRSHLFSYTHVLGDASLYPLLARAAPALSRLYVRVREFEVPAMLLCHTCQPLDEKSHRVGTAQYSTSRAAPTRVQVVVARAAAGRARARATGKDHGKCGGATESCSQNSRHGAQAVVLSLAHCGSPAPPPTPRPKTTTTSKAQDPRPRDLIFNLNLRSALHVVQ